MSSLVGMDAEAVRALANRLRSQADALQGVVGRIDAIANQIGQSWHGHDATDFLGWWQQQHRPSLLAAHQSLAGLAQSADNNAAQQDRTSAATGQGAVAGSAVAGGVIGIGAAAAVGSAAASAAASSTGAPAAGAAPAPGGGASRQASVGRFVDAYPVGATVGPGDSNGQCVGLFEEYSMKYVHTPEIFTGPYGGGACDLYTHFNDIPGLKDHYTQLPASAVPQAGDVAVWDSSTPYSEGYGHVAIVTGTAGSTVHVLQQNVVPNKISDGSFQVGEAHLLGYLRPDSLS